MKTLVRLAILGVAACLALTAVFFLIPAEPAAPSSEATVFSSGEPVDVKAVAVNNASGAYSFYYEGDGYVLDNIPPQVADLNAFIEFMTNCARLSSLRRLPASGADLAAYGLDEPAANTAIEFFDGRVLTLSIGAQEPVSQSYYAQVEGYDGVYVMSGAMIEPFLKPKTQILSMLVTPELEWTSPLSAVRNISFKGAGFARPVEILTTATGDEELKLTALAFGAPTHLVRGHADYQLDQTYGSEILGSLFGVEADEISGYGLSEAQVMAYGFEEPYMEIEYDAINAAGEARHMRLLIAEADGDGRYYATLDGSGAVYVIGRKPFMDLQYDKLLLRWFLTPLIMDLSGVTVDTGAKSYRFDIDHTNAQNPVFLYDGQELDAALFRSFFRLITSAAHDGAYLGPQNLPAGDPLLTITYEYANPAKSPDTLALYPGSARRVLAFVNGKCEFAMKDAFAGRVIAGCVDLIAGNSIEEAIFHGLCEVIERDAWSIVETSNNAGSVITNIYDNDINHLLNLFSNAGVEIILRNITSDINIPTIAAVCDDIKTKDPTLLCLGMGTHTSPKIAVLRALTEVAQSRATQIHGAREDTIIADLKNKIGYDRTKNLNKKWFKNNQTRINRPLIFNSERNEVQRGIGNLRLRTHPLIKNRTLIFADNRKTKGQ